MRRIRVHIYNKRTNIIIEKGNKEDVSVVDNVFSKKHKDERQMLI